MANHRQHATVHRPTGLHARAATAVSRAAGQFQARVRIATDSASADAASILELLGLGLVQGAAVTVEADGPDAEAALRQIVRLVEDEADGD